MMTRSSHLSILRDGYFGYKDTLPHNYTIWKILGAQDYLGLPPHTTLTCPYNHTVCPTKKVIFGPQGCGALMDKKFIKKEFFSFLNICRASASKRILANQLEHKVY